MTTTIALAILSVTQSLGLPPGLLSAMSYVESRHNVKAINHRDGYGDSLGACQIKYSTARMIGYQGNADRLLDPRVNAYWAALYLKHQLERYDGDVVRAISAYNSGTYRLDKTGKPVNLDYVRKVLNAWKEHR